MAAQTYSGGADMMVDQAAWKDTELLFSHLVGETGWLWYEALRLMFFG